MPLSCIISEIKRDVGRKLRFFIHPLHSTFPLGGSRRTIATPFGTEKLEWCGYPTAKQSDDIFSRFDRIPACDGRTDTVCDGIVRAMHSIAR